MQQCGIILLAAGRSSRMGQPKQLLQYKGKSLVQHGIEAALQVGAEPVILVTGANASAVEKQVNDIRVNIVENTGWQEGIASSIRCGLRALLQLKPDIEQAIFMVCDQPFVTGALLNKLLFASQHADKPIIACAYGGTIGIPALFGKAYFPLLLGLEADEGAKKIMRQYPGSVGAVDFPLGGIDIDTQEDYDKLQNEF